MLGDYIRRLKAWNRKHDPFKKKIMSIGASALKAILGAADFLKISTLEPIGGAPAKVVVGSGAS